MFRFYNLLEIVEKSEELEEDVWMQRAGVDPTNKYAKQWRSKIIDAAKLRQRERQGKPDEYGSLSRDSFSNAQSMKRLLKSKPTIH